MCMMSWLCSASYGFSFVDGLNRIVVGTWGLYSSNREMFEPSVIILRLTLVLVDFFDL
jgi:hypothetical protein